MRRSRRKHDHGIQLIVLVAPQAHSGDSAIVRSPDAVPPRPNPYHAVSIKAGKGCHQTAQKYGRQRFLSGEAPQLPQPTCNAKACECRYVHHEDRRDGSDRRQREAHDVWAMGPQLAKGGGRRAGQGRRVTDH